MEKTIYELFDELDPKQKASFIDARIDWATNAALCGEVTLRLCHATLCGEITLRRCNPTEDNV